MRVLDEPGDTEEFNLVVDALFGFGFAGPVRSPFDRHLDFVWRQDAPVVSVDVPSGWAVDAEACTATAIQPDMLVSLSAPKLSARAFTGRHHLLGGRFLPPALAEGYGLGLPRFPCTQQWVRLQ